MKVIQVAVWDHSNLGGPMGTEETHIIETKLFENEESALDWAINKALSEIGEDDDFSNQIKKAKGNKTRLKKELADIGHIGFTFSEKEANK